MNKAKLPHLKRLLKYKNKQVVERYCNTYSKKKYYANKVFLELMKFFWLSQKTKLKKQYELVTIYPDMIHIDNMWHTFVLFTKDYQKFCNNYFGTYIHHTPQSGKAPPRKLYNEKLSASISYVYDELGEKTVRFWFNV